MLQQIGRGFLPQQVFRCGHDAAPCEVAAGDIGAARSGCHPALPDHGAARASAYLSRWLTFRCHPVVDGCRRRPRARTAYATGIAAEDLACAALRADGWTIHARRLRTKAGEVDAVAEKAGILAMIEVKHRPTPGRSRRGHDHRQQSRLLGACEIILGEHPDWGINGVRFDVLLVDPAGRVRRIADAFRLGDPTHLSRA